MSGKTGISRSLDSDFTPLFSSTSWRTLLNSSSSEGKLYFQIPTKTYSKRSITSLTDEHIPIQSDTSFISYNQSLSVDQTFFQKKTHPFPLALQMKVLWWRYRKHQPSSSSLKHKEWHSVLKELGLDRVTNVITWKKKLYDRIWTTDSVLCKLR